MSERVRLGSSAAMACPARHCWVNAAADGGVRRPGLLLEWRQTSGGQRWQGRVVYAAQLRASEWARDAARSGVVPDHSLGAVGARLLLGRFTRELSPR
jgi:hypothetical protein